VTMPSGEAPKIIEHEAIAVAAAWSQKPGAVGGRRRGVVSLQRLSALRGLSTEEVLGELTSAGVHPPSAEPAWAVPESLPDPSLDLADLDALLEDEDGA